MPRKKQTANTDTPAVTLEGHAVLEAGLCAIQAA